MKSLSNIFFSTIHNLGMNELRHPIFYNAPIGIRFELGATESVYLETDGDEWIKNPKYITQALNRAKSIYENLPEKPNLLRIDAYPDELPTEMPTEKIISTICKAANLPTPHEIKVTPFQWEEDDDVITQLQLYWDLNQFDFNSDILLKQIIEADLGGCKFFSSNVYLVNTHHAILYYVYDDRGADLIVRDKKLIYPLFIQFNDWILEYDREHINNIFL